MTEENKNLKVWNALCETDPKYTKSFSRAGGFKGTAQNATYAIRKMTERFGPCGKGWGTGKPEFTFQAGPNNQTLVYCTICVWYIDDDKVCELWGVGGDTVVVETKYGLKIDDEACKKATTDALTNAMKQIGMAADLHLGMYDDNKYVNGLKEKYKENTEEAKPEQEPQPSSANPKPPLPFTEKEMNWIRDEISKAVNDEQLEKAKTKARAGWRRMTEEQQIIVRGWIEAQTNAIGKQ